MTNERAIEILNPEHREYYKDIEIVNEACRMGMEALEYRTPKKPIFQAKVYFGFDGHTCPTCGRYIKSKNDPLLPKFCRNCGQALDWS